MSAGVDLSGWVPAMARASGGSLRLSLFKAGSRRFTEPFFDDTVRACLSSPFHAVFRREVEVSQVERWLLDHPPLPPAGFIFHVSRCGSTLASQLLAALPQHRVMSEATPIDGALRSGGADVPNTTRVAWLRATLGLLGQRGDARERRLFVKFDSWHAVQLPLIRQAFPDVPWLMLVRDPVEVIVSHLRQAGAQMVPGLLGFGPSGVDPSTAWTLPRETYAARVLGDICQAALGSVDQRARVVDYSELPAAFDTVVWPHFGVRLDDAGRQALALALGRDAKSPHQGFLPDTETKQQAADASTREAAAQWVDPAYRQLRLHR